MRPRKTIMAGHGAEKRKADEISADSIEVPLAEVKDLAEKGGETDRRVPSLIERAPRSHARSCFQQRTTRQAQTPAVTAEEAPGGCLLDHPERCCVVLSVSPSACLLPLKSTACRSCGAKAAQACALRIHWVLVLQPSQQVAPCAQKQMVARIARRC